MRFGSSFYYPLFTRHKVTNIFLLAWEIKAKKTLRTFKRRCDWNAKKLGLKSEKKQLAQK